VVFTARLCAGSCLTGGAGPRLFAAMPAATNQNFQDYKRAEAKALEIMREMKQTTPRTVDIELALLVAVFELHKTKLPGSAVAKIVQGHLAVLTEHYAQPVAPAQPVPPAPPAA
jgi:hypothetical protein